jgi:predicted amidophosphoribosyltransferase
VNGAVFGNGNNDRLLLQKVKENGGLCVAVKNGEGCSIEALLNAHLLSRMLFKHWISCLIRSGLLPVSDTDQTIPSSISLARSRYLCEGQRLLSPLSMESQKEVRFAALSSLSRRKAKLTTPARVRNAATTFELFDSGTERRKRCIAATPCTASGVTT